MENQVWCEPLVFRPVYQPKVWGGRLLETRYGRELPGEGAYGESWELVDRADAQVRVRRGRGEGLTLHELWVSQRATVFGEVYGDHPAERFPLLVKILDAREALSVQVHPPSEAAAALGGEPKTEMWYIAGVEAGGCLYAGMRRGTGAKELERGIAEGTVEDCVHVLHPREGDFLYLPSGRLHAIGAGLLIYEIQENSDTTYRVFDWNRKGSDGVPRTLHLEESMQCIDFNDVEPGLGAARGEVLVSCAHFEVKKRCLLEGVPVEAAPEGRFAVVTVVAGRVTSGGECFGAGDFFLIPAVATEGVRMLEAVGGAAEILLTGLPWGE